MHTLSYEGEKDATNQITKFLHKYILFYLTQHIISFDTTSFDHNCQAFSTKLRNQGSNVTIHEIR